jgi:hypothetical protein
VRKKRNTLRDTELERRRAQGTCRKKRLREFHYMRCPKCGMELTEPIMLRKHIVAGLLALTLVL